MGRLIISTQITADGVIDQVEDWLTIDWDTGAGAAWRDQLLAADALLLGHPTYEALSAIWPQLTDDVGYAERMNSMPKHVVSRSARGPLEWNSHALPGDLAEGVMALKETLAGNLFAPGCGELAHSLVAAGVADEVLLWVHPLVLGVDGARPFHGRGRIALELAGSTAFDNGVVCQTYRPL